MKNETNVYESRDTDDFTLFLQVRNEMLCRLWQINL